MGHVYKLIEVVGSSSVSSDDAVNNAIAAAGMKLEHIGWFEVVEHRGHVEGSKVAHWQVTVKIGFRIKE